MNEERQAFEHLQAHHLEPDGSFYPLVVWSTPVEEVARRRALGICTHDLKTIYSERDLVE